MSKGLPKHIKNIVRRIYNIELLRISLTNELENWLESQGINHEQLRAVENNSVSEVLTCIEYAEGGDVEDLISSLEQDILSLKGVKND